MGIGSRCRFVCEVLQVTSLSPPSLSLSRLYMDETNSAQPILFVTTPGSDPSRELEELALATGAEATGKNVVLRALAMGGGQFEEALDAIRWEGAEASTGICLYIFMSVCYHL